VITMLLQAGSADKAVGPVKSSERSETSKGIEHRMKETKNLKAGVDFQSAST